ncbi:dihydrolipoyl dehydrogenase [soil metagenome]
MISNSKIFDVIIIGAGSAGLAARAEVSRRTSNYLLVERGPFGTTCARVGCMPSKVLIEAADICDQFEKLPRIGVHARRPKVDGKAFLRYLRSKRDHFVSHVMTGMESWRRTHLIVGLAEFQSENSIQISGRIFRAKKFIIATGSRPSMPGEWRHIPGIMTTDDVFEMKRLPKSLVVIGSGPVGLELGQGFARLGVRVTAIGRIRHIGGLADAKMARSARDVFSREMSIIDGKVDVVSRSGRGFSVLVGSRKLSATAVLVAVGRQPNVEELNLAAAGASFSKNGTPKFDEGTFRINGTRCYLAGDASNVRPILHEAVWQGLVVAKNALSKKDSVGKPKTKLGIVFSDPQIASVGQGPRELRKRKLKFVTGVASFENQGRAVIQLRNQGELAVYVSLKGKLLGAEIFGPSAEHLAHLLAWSVAQNLSIDEILSFPVYHPTLEEALITALKNARRKIRSMV